MSEHHDDGLRPDSIAHSDRKRATFNERYEIARRLREIEQQEFGGEISVSAFDGGHPAWAVRRVEQFAADQRARIAQRHPRAGYRDGHPKWAWDRVEKGLGS